MGNYNTIDQSPSFLTIGEWVHKRRKALDMTQKLLASQVGVSYSTIRKIESGERHPSRQVASLLAKYLEIQTDQTEMFLWMASEDQKPGGNLVETKDNCQENSKFPYEVVPLIGRECELAAVETLLQDPACRLVSLVGQGGVGKTRLALEIARLEEREYLCGVVFVRLEETIGVADALERIGRALNQENSIPPNRLGELLKLAYRNKLLLILDGVEHLGAEFARLVLDIIQQGPQVKVLTTSRQQLQLHGEWVYRLHGLSQQIANGEQASDSAQLFIQCARRNVPDMIFGEEDLPDIERICQLIGGLPLAIELAATWVPVLSLIDIGDEIQKDIDFLRLEAPDLPDRHRSLRAVFRDTWRMLSEKEQRDISALSQLCSPFTREMAQEKTSVELDTLSALVSKSLLEHTKAESYDVDWLVRRYTSFIG